MDDAPARLYRFDAFSLDTRRRELREGGGEAIPLTAKAFDTLCALVRNRDRIVGKDELLDTVWPGRVVEENNLSQAMHALRRALGTDASEHRYVVTVPGRGYRFVADVVEVDGDAPAHARAAPPPAAAAAGVPDAKVAVGVRTAAAALPRRHEVHPAARRAVALGALAFMLVLFALAAWRLREPAPTPFATPAATATLAVLPFRSLSGAQRDELLELGLAETLATRLGRSAALRVRSMASVRRLAGEPADALAVARQLDAAYVVEGSTQRVGDDVRVNVRMWSVADGRTALSQTFDARIDRVFTLQDEIGDAVTAALRLQPVVVSPRAASPCEGGDAEAFRALLRAQYQLHRRAPGTVAAFHDVIRRDPACSRAYAGLATAYLFMAHNDRPPDEVFPLARGAAEQALRIDPESAEGSTALGRYLQLHGWDWRGAEAALRRAIDRNPSLAEARFGLAHLLVGTGRADEGLAEMRRALELDPLSPLMNALEGGFLTAARRPREAAAAVARALELQPDFWIALLVRGGMALDRGDPAAAVADLRRAVEGSGRASQAVAMLAFAHVAAGDRGAAEALLAELERRDAAGYLPATSLAAVHTALGDTAAALDLLERAHAERDIRIAFLGADARWNSLRDQPRYRALASRLGLPGGPAAGRY